MTRQTRHRPICIAPLRAHWQALPEAPRGSDMEAAGAAAALDLVAIVHFHSAGRQKGAGALRCALDRARCGMLAAERAARLRPRREGGR